MRAEVDVDEACLESTIRHVALYRSGAVVTREARLTGGRWPGRVLLEPLPLSLEDESVRARVVAPEGAGGDVPQPVDVRVELRLPPLGEALEPPTEAALRTAAERVKELEFLVSRIDEANENIDRLTFELPDTEVGEPAPPVSPALWIAAAAWVQAAKERRAERKVRLRRDLRGALEELRRLERRAAETGARRGLDEATVFKRVVVTLGQGGGAGPARLQLEYQVPGATWRPTYAIRVDPGAGRATLSARALVAQRTGEPWERVRLSVSTAALRREVTLPELGSLRIGRRQPERGRRAWRPPPEGAEELFADLDQALASQPAPRRSPLVEPEAGGPFGDARGERDEDSTAVGIPGQAAARRPTPRPPGAAGGGGAELERQLAPQGVESASGELHRVVMASAAQALPPAAAPAPLELRAALDEVGEVEDRPYLGAPPARAPAARGHRLEHAGSSAEAEEGTFASPAARIVVPGEMIDYPSLRLGGWDEEAHARGALRRQPLRLGGASDARGRWVEELHEALASARRGAADLADFPASTRDVAEAAGAFDARIDADGLVDVPSDGRPRGVPLLAREGAVTMALVVVPRESDQAVRSATLRNPLGVPVLAGPADVYLGDEFLVTSRLETVPAGGDLVVGLGVEEALKVARNTRFTESTQGLLFGTLSLEHRVEVEIASRLATRVDVEVRERVPVIADDEKDISVDLGEAEPPWEDYEQTPEHPLRGGKRWRFALDPGETRRVSYSYAIRIDSKHELAGGNRRERE
jgi:hypothetical protein